MKLCDFPLLSGELAQFSCDDLGADWQIGEAVSVQAHGNDYLLLCRRKRIRPVGEDSHYRVPVLTRPHRSANRLPGRHM